MPSALETLVKILKLERDQGYRNTAVIGGLGAFAENWRQDAHAQARMEMHHLLVDDIAQLLAQYEEIIGKPERHEMVSYMLDRIMMRITEPRSDFVPSQDWSKVSDKPSTEPSAHPQPNNSASHQPKDTSPKSSKPSRTTKAKKSEQKPSPSRGDNNTQDFEASDNDWLNGASPHTAPTTTDLPAVPRLTSPPRQPRRAYAPDEAADLMDGLQSPVSVVKGVGKRMVETLKRIGIQTVNDLLFYLPRRYDDYTQLLPLRKLEPDTVVTVIGTVRSPHIRGSYGGRKDFAFTLDDGTGTILVTFFGQQWMRSKVREGSQIVLSGKVTLYRNALQMSNPEWEPMDAENLHTRGIVPVYRLTKGLNAKRFRKLMHDTVHYWADRLPDFMPSSVLDRTDLADLGWMLKNIHFPEGHDHLRFARERFVFDELLLMQLTILANRREWQSVKATPLPIDDGWLDNFLDAVFPYALTGAQQRALHDIQRDLALDVPMNRLVQGDVGSGKTAVAITALAIAYANHHQAALMAPTSILAEQHFRTVSETLAKMPGDHQPTVALLTGSLKKREREAVYAGLADGTIDMVIGTHALIQSDVTFHNLGLAILDEQHRFGVEQRGALRGKGTNPHLLVMTATPIPRTLALTLYADLDLSVIDEMPPGRTPVKTALRGPESRERCYDFIERQLEEGRQAFIVHPLVEASDKLETVPSAVEAYDSLKEVFYRYRVGLLHGKMKPDEKDTAMHAFANGEFDILVTTSVAEVGVNIPNASVMMIEGANRFGLSQLHQFRGRVGRGEHPGYCLLLPDKLTDTAEERLTAMVETHDGFALAEMDWKLRGAGDLLGTRQSGANQLQLQEQMNPELVTLANREARTIYAEDAELTLEEHHLLRQRVQQLQNARSDVS